MADLVTAGARARPSAPALLTTAGAVETFAELDSRVGTLRGWLETAGIRPTDVVALSASGGVGTVGLLLAIASQAVCAPLPPDLPAAELEAAIERLGPRLLIADWRPPAGGPELSVPVVALEPDPSGRYPVFPLALPRLPHGRHVQLTDVALLLATSGTTGRSKLVPLRSDGVLRAARLVAGTLGLSGEDRCINVMPLHHTHGLVGSVLATLAAGGSAICVPGFAETLVTAAMRELEPTWYSAVPAIHARLCALAESGRLDVRGSRLRFVRSTSSHLPPSLRGRLETAFGVPVVEAYALTEAPGQVCSQRPAAPGPVGSVGRPAGCEVRVVDGEVQVRGGHVSEGYLDAADGALERHPEGWLRTGDVGALDPDGTLRLLGRQDDIIDRAGEKIAPQEVEDVLLGCAGVRDVAVLGVPDAVLGHALAALVVVEPGTAPDVLEFAWSRLAAARTPDMVRLVERIPRTETGKVLRRELPDCYEAAAPAPPADILEATAGIWREVLHQPGAGLDDHILDLGGASLHAARVETLVGEQFRVQLPAGCILSEAPTIRTLAMLVERLL